MWSFGEGPIKNLRDSLIAIKRKAHKLIKKKVVYLGILQNMQRQWC
jgi:hypothetical protein